MPPSSDTAETDVVLGAHLHARPAAQLVKEATRFRSTLRITYGDKTADVTGILAVMGLGATAGATITVHATGADAHSAVAEIAALLRAAEH